MFLQACHPQKALSFTCASAVGSGEWHLFCIDDGHFFHRCGRNMARVLQESHPGWEWERSPGYDLLVEKTIPTIIHLKMEKKFLQ